MPQISILDLSPVGSSLFADGETYLKELTDAQSIQGGNMPTTDTTQTIYTQNGSTYICSDCMGNTQRTTMTNPTIGISW